MVRNYLIISFRNQLKHKLFSFINIFGLALGMAVALVIWQYVSFELNYDAYNEKAPLLYRVTSSIYSSGELWPLAGHDLGPSLSSDIPEIKQFVRMHPMYGGAVVSYNRTSTDVAKFRESELLYVDSTILDSFSFEVVYGQLEHALSRPFTAVVTKHMAEKYFGKGIDPVGRDFQVAGYYPGSFQVTAVIEDLPDNTSRTMGFLLSIHSLLSSEDYRDHGKIDNFFTYVELDPHASKELVESKMASFLDKYLVEKGTHNPVIKLQPLLDIHFEDGGSINTVYVLMTLSVFILFIAWINYINLSTARASERAREIGVKKAIGAQRSQLMMQFFTESMLANLTAVVITIALAIPLFSILGSIIDKTLAFDFNSLWIWYRLVGLFVAGSIISGIYPALIMSSIKVNDVIKGRLNYSKTGFKLRKVLVVFQFAASLLLIIGTFVMYKQINFMQNSISASSDHILIVKGPMAGEASKKEDRLTAFKNELNRLAAVKEVATSEAIPGSGYNWGVHASRKGALNNETTPGQNIDVVFVDPDFMKVYDISMRSGRIWNPMSTADMSSIIINEACVPMFGLRDQYNALNESILFDQGQPTPILGVYKNFHWYSLRDSFKPMALWPQKICSAYYSVVLTGDFENSIDAIRTLYQSTFPGNPFDYWFHNEFFNWQYNADRQFIKVFGLFAILAIMIACLGLIGLASFSTIQKLKEVSVRKVLGASTSSIISLLSVEILFPILLSGVFAIPIAVYGVSLWLDTFAFRISITWELFVFPLIALAFIAWISISIQIVRGASINPAKVLRSE